ncbi:unnamed protein product [Schistosoma turkestanicum]|nr:unnamed protein product [Schistosoma turkestanicum]
MELDLSLNQISSLPNYAHGFNSLNCLNLSYNFLQPMDIEKLGYLPSLRILYLCGNDLRRLPPDLAETGSDSNGHIVFKFAKLEILYLDDNKLSDAQDFASLATLPRLTYLNLANNRFTTVPLLKSISLKKHQNIKLQHESTIENASCFFKPSTNFINETIQSNNLLVSFNQQSKNNESLMISGNCLKAPPSHHKFDGDNPSDLNNKQLANNRPGMTINRRTLGKPNHLSSLRRKKFHKQQKQQRYTTNHSLSMEEYRNPNAPRIRIVNEFVSLHNLKKLFPLIHKKQTKSNHHIDCNKLNQSNTDLLLTPREKNPILPSQTFTTDEPVLLDIEQKCDISMNNSYVPPPPPPFQSLQCIDLSHNKISCEEHLLPIAVWPKLKECLVYANPVISRSSKTPPLLERLLIQQLGIHLHRHPIENSSLFDIKNTNLLLKNNELQHLSFTTYGQNIQKNEINTTDNNNNISSISSSSMMHSRISSNTNISKCNNKKPIVIRYELDKSSLDVGPKMAKCNVEQMLKQIKMSNQTNSLDSSKSSSSSSPSSSNRKPVQLSNLPNSSTFNNSMFNNNSRRIPHSSQSLSSIERDKTFIRNDSKKSDQNLSELLADLQCNEQIDEVEVEEDDEEEDMNNFFTTQLSSVNATEYHTSKKLNHSNQFDQRNTTTENDNNNNSNNNDSQSSEQDEDKTLMNCPINPGALSSNLEWSVDEKTFPDSMQACVRELRYLLQHKPTIHSPFIFPGDDSQPIGYSTESLSSSSYNLMGENTAKKCKVQVSDKKSSVQVSSSKQKVHARNTLSSTSTSSTSTTSLSSMKLVPVCKDLEILPSKLSLNQFTSYTEIPLTKALKDEENEKRQLERIKAKQNPLVRKSKLPKTDNQMKRTKLKGPKELFDQFHSIYANVREEAITQALDIINHDFDNKTEQLCQNIY